MNERRLAPSVAALIDVVLVIAFCVLGRLSHASGILGDLPGTLNTIWPFLAAALLVHVVMLVARVRTDRMLPGALIWAITVVGGLLLRVLSGQGTAVPFVIVATLTLALLLIGWRGILALVRRVRSGRPA